MENDDNEVSRKNDYKCTQAEVRELLAQIADAVTEHEKTAMGWEANMVILSAKSVLIRVLGTLKQAPKTEADVLQELQNYAKR